LVRHKNAKHGGTKYGCNLCDYKATMKDILVLHKQNSKHEGVSYGCNQCNFKADSRDLLIPHKQSIHKGVRYECDMCSYKAIRRRNHALHIEHRWAELRRAHALSYKCGKRFRG